LARGRAIFSERLVGVIANRQLLKTVPAPYRAAQLAAPVLAPIDPFRPLGALVPVRCADCHAAAPLETRGPIGSPPLGRCSHCHWGHPPDGRDEAAQARAAPATAEVAACTDCHSRHPAFGPVAYSSGLLLPFDSDGDGNAQDDERDDRRAGGIGTEALLSFDVPRAQRPFTVELAAIGNARHAGTVTRQPSGVAWVRVAPLVGVFATAPYLHNGSVPTLRALLEPAARRPVSFPLGQGGFVLDTRQPGNRNLGHEFGTGLTAREKDDLVAFLRSL
jgi:cytochrome c peroxidase